jgi:L-lactate dehydrogenase complex protein LldG
MTRWRGRRPLDARTEVLDRIRRALADPTDDAATSANRRPIPRGYRSTGGLAPGSPELIELLVDRLVDYRAVVHVISDPTEIPATLRKVLAGVRSAVVPPWLDATWVTAAAGAGVTVLTDAPTIPLRTAALEAVDVVLTGARVAIAETGTIVLDAGPDQGRRVITLLPDRHVCVVRAEQVVQTVPEAIAILGRAPARPQTWISGPSATSDIELTRVEGVHGPRTLDVVLLSP